MPVARVCAQPTDMIYRPLVVGKERSYSADKLSYCKQQQFLDAQQARRYCQQHRRGGAWSQDRLFNLPCTCCSTTAVNGPAVVYQMYTKTTRLNRVAESSVWLPRSSSTVQQSDSLTAARQPSVARRVQNNNLMHEEAKRKRSYRIAVNLFNKTPDRGVRLLIDWGFVAGSPQAVARFLLSRKGLSRQMIGNYVGNIQDDFCCQVLRCMTAEMNLRSMDLDVALRHFLHHFHLPGEAQKIERIMQSFAERYCQCNPSTAGSSAQRQDAVFVLAFAIIMLNTDLHSPNVKAHRRMKREDFVKNLQRLDEGRLVNPALLSDIYDRIKAQELRTGSDHVAQVVKVDRRIVGADKPSLPLAHRRLICYIRLTEVLDPTRKQSSTAHQREAFLFNDLIMLTKVLAKKKDKPLFQYRDSYRLSHLQLGQFSTPAYPYGIKLRAVDSADAPILYYNAACQEDRRRFVEDLEEAILECREMIKLEDDLKLIDDQVKCSRRKASTTNENRDSGVADVCCEAAVYGMSTSSGDLHNLPNACGSSVHKAISDTSVDSGLVDNLKANRASGGRHVSQ